MNRVLSRCISTHSARESLSDTFLLSGAFAFKLDGEFESFACCARVVSPESSFECIFLSFLPSKSPGENPLVEDCIEGRIEGLIAS